MKHTIFTPVYNRAGNMMELAKHISELDYAKSDYEWIIVDDGSTDNLNEVIDRIKFTYQDINIKIIHKENGGIHTAQNCAIKNALGDYVTRIDSDDYLLPDSLKNYDKALDNIPESQIDNIVGVVGLCINSKDRTVRGTAFPKESQISKGYLLKRKGVTGDKNFCMKTSIMRKYLIPEYIDTKWVPEGGVLWLELDKKYDTLFINFPISVCTEPNASSYLGALKKNSLSNTMSIYYSSTYIINFGKGYYPILTIISAYLLASYALMLAKKYNKDKYRTSRLFKDIKAISDKAIICLFIPVSYLYSLYKK